MLNRVCLMGRLTRDPELRQTQNGVSVTTFTLAVDRNYQADKNNRQADFINIVAWRHTAEFAEKYFTKGQLVAVEGSIKTRSYQDKDGNSLRVPADKNNHLIDALRYALESEINAIPASQPPKDYGNDKPSYWQK